MALCDESPNSFDEFCRLRERGIPALTARTTAPCEPRGYAARAERPLAT